MIILQLHRQLLLICLQIFYSILSLIISKLRFWCRSTKTLIIYVSTYLIIYVSTYIHTYVYTYVHLQNFIVGQCYHLFVGTVAIENNAGIYQTKKVNRIRINIFIIGIIKRTYRLHHYLILIDQPIVQQVLTQNLYS